MKATHFCLKRTKNGGNILANVADKVSALIKQTVENQGVSLWDVRFVKEGASYYLRVFIEEEDGEITELEIFEDFTKFDKMFKQKK